MTSRIPNATPWASSVQPRRRTTSGPGPPGAAQTDGAHAVICNMQVLAEQVHYLQVRLAMGAQKTQQFLAPDHSHLGIAQGLRSYLVRTAGQRGTEPQNFTGSRDTKGQTFAGLGAHRELYPAFAEDKDAAA